MGRTIGIDLGTTNSCVAVVDRNETIVIANSEGSRTTPSVVAVGDKGETLVGQMAKRQAVTNPHHTVYAVKRLIGRRSDDPDVERFREVSPFEICEAENGDAWVNVGGKARSPEEISAEVLGKMRSTAQDFLGEEVTDAVITVPAYFNDAQRQATKDAGKIAGLNVLRIINEPTAAALAYGLEHEATEKIVVFDLGGGTLDVSILQIGEGVFQVLATHGDTFLGGEDFDQLIVSYLADCFQGEHGIDLRSDAMALQRLKEAAERGKRELSSAAETDINLPFLCANEEGPKHLNHILTREKLEELVAPLIERLDSPCRGALEDASLQPSDVDQVLLVGGMTRMPRVQAKVEEIFGQPPHRGVNPDEVVAIGAGIQASVLAGETDDVLLLDVTPLSLGVETQGGVMTKIIPRNTTVPTRKSQVFSTTEDNQNLVRIHVLQGEREMAEDNHSLARFELVGIAPAPRGVPQIEVTFDIDADGILNVSARDLGTGQRQEVRVNPTGGLSKEQVEDLVGQAEEHSDADVRRRADADLRNNADALLYSVEQMLNQYKENLDEEVCNELREAVARVRKEMEGDGEALSQAVEELQELAYKSTDLLYGQAGPSSPAENDETEGFIDD
jgi:molecular chaperone DnaK